MEVYLFIFVVVAALTPLDSLRLTQNARLTLLVIPLVFLILLAGTRFETGNDWTAYFEYYRSLASLQDKEDDFEIGYRLFSYACKSLGLTYQEFLFVAATVYMGLFFLAFRKQRGAAAIILLFYCTYLLGWMGTARQVIAIGLTVWAGEFLLSRRPVIFTALVLLAATFHQTALVFLFALALPCTMLSSRSYIIATILCIVGGALLANILPTAIDALAGSEGLGEKVIFYGNIGSDELGQAGGPVLQVLWYVKRLFFLALFILMRSRFDTPVLKFYFNAYFVSVVIFLLINPSLPILATRGANYFSIYELFLLAALIPRQRGFHLVTISFLVLLSGQRLYTSLYSYHPDLYIPYKGFFINQDFHREMH